MTTKNTGGHAFPTQSWEYDVGDRVLQYQEPGMSLRDYFAAKAMQGWVADSMRFDEASIKRAAQFAYAMADAMLKAREEEMNIDIEKERADFEAACRQHAKDAGYDDSERLERDGDGYADPATQAAWWGWREGRAALQSQHDEETKRLRDALKLARDRARGFMNDSGADTDSLPEIDAALAQEQS